MRAAGLVALAALGVACSYDLDALRRRDGSVVDRPRADVGFPQDQGTADVAGDQGVAPTDAGVVDQDALRAGACNVTGAAVVALAPPIAPSRPGGQPATLAYAMGSVQNLQGAPQLGLPTVMADGGAVLSGCPTRDDTRTPPTRIYRYQVAEGGSVTATTNTQHCTTLDTRVYAMWSCGAGDVASPLGCADDLTNGRDTARCPTCGAGSDAGVACTPLVSTLDLGVTPQLRRGDVVFFAVTGFDVTSSNSAHRLWVGENAARIEAFPASPTRTPVNRCACQTSTDSPRTVYFPYPVTGENFPTTVSATGASTSFLGVRDLPQGMYTGAGLQLRIARWNLSADTTSCPRAMVRAVFDLIVGTSLVTSFSIGADLAPPVTVTVPYTAFAPTLLTRGTAGMVFELRLRQVLPDPACLTIDLDGVQGASAVTLYGG